MQCVIFGKDVSFNQGANWRQKNTSNRKAPTHAVSLQKDPARFCAEEMTSAFSNSFKQPAFIFADTIMDEFVSWASNKGVRV